MGQTHSTAVTIDKDLVGGATHANFPVGILVTLARLKTIANGGHVVNGNNGFDIRVYADVDLTTPLDHELVSYDATTGELELYFRQPSLSHLADTVVYLGYGDPTLNTDGSTAGVWDADFIAVYHFGSSVALSVNDSTANARHLTNDGGNVALAPGLSGVGGAALFANSATNRLYFAGLGLHTVKRTTSMLFKSSSFAAPGHFDPLLVMSGTVPTAAWGISIYFDGKVYFGGRAGSTPMNINGSVATIGLDEVHAISMSYSTDVNLSMVIDGASDTEAGYPGFGDIDIPSVAPMTDIGYDGAGSEYLNGLLDEMRFSKVKRPLAWGLCTANNLETPGTFLTFGSENAAVTGPTPGFTTAIDRKTVTVTSTAVAGDNSITSREYDYGDGSGLTASTSHTYDDEGTYTITQYVNDGVTAEQSVAHDIVTQIRWKYRLRGVPSGGLSNVETVDVDSE